MPIPVPSTGSIITTDDLASYLRDPSLASDSSAAMYVNLANGLVGEVVGSPSPIPTRVTAITLEVAARAWRNPNGYSSETVDDYTYRRDADSRAAGVYLTPSELAELQGTTAPLSGVFTLDLGTPA